jgi:hypothetical protein
LNRTARPAKTLSPDTGLDRSGPPAQSSAFEQIKSNFLPKVTGAVCPATGGRFRKTEQDKFHFQRHPEYLK